MRRFEHTLLQPVWAVLAVLCLSSWASAQVNVEPFRRELPERGLGGRLNGSVTAYQGNTQGVVTGGSFMVGMNQAPHMSFVTGSFDFAHLGGVTQVFKSFGHARYAYDLTRVLSWETYGQVEADRFRELRLREVLGAGPRLEIQNDNLDGALGTAYMLEYLRRNEPTGLVRSDVRHRLSQYLRVALHAGEKALLAATVYYQPRVDDFSDFRVLALAALEFKVTEALRSRIDATFRYESATLSGVKSHDLEIKNSLGVTF